MGDGYPHHDMLQVVDVVVGVIRAARCFIDGAHGTVGANCPATEGGRGGSLSEVPGREVG